MKLINRKRNVVLAIMAAASVVGGGIHALGAIGTKLGLEEASVRSGRQLYRDRGPR